MFLYLRIGTHCTHKNDTRNIMDADKFESLNGRKKRILKVAQKMKESIENLIEKFNNELKPILGNDILQIIYNFNEMNRCIDIIQEEAINLCFEDKKFTCSACRSFHNIQIYYHLFFYYLQIANANMRMIISTGQLLLEKNYKNEVLEKLVEEFENIEIYVDVINQYREMGTQITGLQRLISIKQYCIYHTKEIRDNNLKMINDYEKFRW